MIKTLRLSFSLRDTYRVNSILYSLKQIPLLKKLLPDTLYRLRGLKIFAHVLSILWEICSVFLGKLLYFMFLVGGAGLLYDKIPTDRTFLHILLFLTLIGAYMNTSLFDPTRDKYYAMILMRMNAKEFTLVNYGYAMCKVLVGFLPFCIYYGLTRGVPLWFCLLLPFGVVGIKLAVSAYSLWNYEKRGYVYNENKLRKHLWLLAVLLLVLAYGLPAIQVVLPFAVSVVVVLLWILLGIWGARRIVQFTHYREINQQLLSQMVQQMDRVKPSLKKTSEKAISSNISVSSNRKGFEYLNDLFIKRHQKILWNSTVKIAAICLLLVCGMLLALQLAPTIKPVINKMMMQWLPYFVFIMYMINRGTGFTQALFMNCDHCLLTYSFYKQPKFILKLFQIRLREIIKINVVPALVIGFGLPLILYASGGTKNSLDYAILFVSILCMSIFFSIHYLTIYYLLQPYNAGTEIKSGTYRIIMFVTYLVCYLMMQVKMPILIFGALCIAFCVLYSIVACILVYRFAPKTFRLRA